MNISLFFFDIKCISNFFLYISKHFFENCSMVFFLRRVIHDCNDVLSWIKNLRLDHFDL